MFELAWEVFYMGVLVLLASYGLHRIAYKKGLGDEHDEIKCKDKNDDLAIAEHRFSVFDLILNKWLHFGGGYYGIVALVKLIGIEYFQLQAFVANWESSEAFYKELNLQWLISFFVNQYKSFVEAIIWPTHYLSSFTIWQCAIFVVVTYLAFDYAKQAAKRAIVEGSD